MKKLKDIKNINYVYLFSDVQHLKRIFNFLDLKTDFKIKLLIFLPLKNNNCDETKSFIASLSNSRIDLMFSNYSHIVKNSISKDFFHKEHINLIVDKYINEEEFVLCAHYFRKKDFKLIIIEHNLNFHWDYIFTYQFGFIKKNLFLLLLSKNIYRVLKRAFLSKIKYRLFQRKISFLDIVYFGLLPFADEIYLYSMQSYKYFEKNKVISTIKKEIIDYKFEFLPEKSNNSKYFNICLFAYGAFKGNNKKMIKKQLRALKFIIDYLQDSYLEINYKITIKFKNGSLEKCPSLNEEFGKNISIVENINYGVSKFDLAIIPIDSFIVVEFLRSKIPIITYGIYKNSRRFENITYKNKNILRHINLSSI